MLRTPLYEYHRQSGAKLVEFAGWEMPVVYTGIIEEHHHTRNHASFFDVSHMGRVHFIGPDAGALLERLNTRKIGDMALGQSRYSHMCREDGGILDDVIVSRMEDRWLVVCNASNREKLLGWWQRQKQGFNVAIEDRTFETAMVAIQGPEAVETVGRLLPLPIADLKRYHFRSGRVFGAEYFIARSGYTGEDGVEIIVPANFGMTALNMMIEKSAELGRPIKPAGLGARDTLRTEAAMPLYGHELSEDWDPITAGQAWVVALDKDFIGKEVVAKVKADGPRKSLVGLEIDSKRTPRQGAPILADGEAVGAVTSGVSSPTLGKVIAMGFVPASRCAVGTTFEVDLKSSVLPARVVPLPFYKRPKN
ncbi:MAG: glycine cleavage system aminomethyltransferase GcvT [Phycisphaerae bacterium]|jgi:aminomethyltransferase